MIEAPAPEAKYVPKNRKKEEDLQRRVCNYIRKNYPRAIVYTDFAAGLDLTDHQRMMLMGMRSDDGMPDVYVDYPSEKVVGGKKILFHGLRIELKIEGTVIYKKDRTLRKAPYTRRYRRGGRVFIKRGDHNLEQAATLEKYNRLGYFARYAIGYDNAIKLIDWYFNRPQTESMF